VFVGREVLSPVPGIERLALRINLLYNAKTFPANQLVRLQRRVREKTAFKCCIGDNRSIHGNLEQTQPFPGASSHSHIVRGCVTSLAWTASPTRHHRPSLMLSFDMCTHIGDA
jgi:hypothetical protein